MKGFCNKSCVAAFVCRNLLFKLRCVAFCLSQAFLPLFGENLGGDVQKRQKVRIREDGVMMIFSSLKSAKSPDYPWDWRSTLCIKLTKFQPTNLFYKNLLFFFCCLFFKHSSTFWSKFAQAMSKKDKKYGSENDEVRIIFSSP